MLDYKVSDLKKRLNNLKFKTSQQRSYLDRLLIEQQKVEVSVLMFMTINKGRNNLNSGKCATAEILGEWNPQDFVEDDGGRHGQEQVRPDTRDAEEGEGLLHQTAVPARGGDNSEK